MLWLILQFLIIAILYASYHIYYCYVRLVMYCFVKILVLCVQSHSYNNEGHQCISFFNFFLALGSCSTSFGFSNSYIWFEFYNIPLEQDASLISDTIRSWHIIGSLGGCNSMNMQLSQSPLDKRPSYDPIQGANVIPTTFYNI